jgi:hypothetical protein
MRAVHVCGMAQAAQVLALSLVTLLPGPLLFAQQARDDKAIDKPTLQLLLVRISELEARVAQLEAEKQQAGTIRLAAAPARSSLPLDTLASPTPPPESNGPSAPSSASAQTSSSMPEQDQPQADSAMAERMDLSKTLLRIRGFGDVSLHGDTQKGDTTTFSLGQLDLFITSDVSDRFKFLSEVVFEAGPSSYFGVVQGQENEFDVDIERYLMQYGYNDYLNISAGRGHTAIGYYNTAYHHSTWLQTTTDRPFLFSFEDHGGILPIHNVGASATGRIPSSTLGLHYVAEVGNGRESRTPLISEPVQNEVSDLNHKAFNLALFARPEAIRGLQTGVSVYHDLLAPLNAPKVGETIVAAHAILIRPKYEWLTEALLDRHTPSGTGKAFNTSGFYTLASRQLGSFRPYVRYQYVNAASNEPIFPDVGLRYGPSLGLRYDATESVALKFQYDYTSTRNQPGVSGLDLQLGFTF